MCASLCARGWGGVFKRLSVLKHRLVDPRDTALTVVFPLCLFYEFSCCVYQKRLESRRIPMCMV